MGDDVGELEEKVGKRGEYTRNEAIVPSLEDIVLQSSDESSSVVEMAETGEEECGAIERRNDNVRDDPKSAVERNGELMLKEPVDAKSAEGRKLEEEVQLLKTVCDGQQDIEFHIEQLTAQVEAKRCKLKELESEWDVKEKSLQEKKRYLQQSVVELYPEVYAKFTRRKEIELEIEVNLAEIKGREEEISELSPNLAKQPKLAPRHSHIDRIIEITKNSRKQDGDIQRILKDTRELQLESNTVHERLNRTYAVIDETIFREAKKDPVAGQAYRLLTRIHESFEQIAEKILATDRNRRDAANYEDKLAIISGRSMNTDKLRADLDAITKENDLLEQRLRNL